MHKTCSCLVFFIHSLCDRPRYCAAGIVSDTILNTLKRILRVKVARVNGWKLVVIISQANSCFSTKCILHSPYLIPVLPAKRAVQFEGKSGLRMVCPLIQFFLFSLCKTKIIDLPLAEHHSLRLFLATP